MKYSVVGEFKTLQKSEIGWVANAADQLARAGFPVPYSLVLTKSVFEEFLVESGAVSLFFSLIKKGKFDKAASLVTSTSMPKKLEEELLDLLDSHNIKEFDLHSSPVNENAEYHCYKLRRSHLTHALKACWASAIKEDSQDPFSAVMVTKHLGTKKTGKLYSQHPINKSREHCVIEMNRPKKAVFYIETNTGKVENAKDFHNLESPLLVEEKNELLMLVHQAHSFSPRPLIINWLLGNGVYALTYKELKE